MAIQYPSIPSPTADPAALYQSVLALKGTVDTLTGGIGSGDAAVVTSAGAAATAASVAAASAASAASVAASIAAIIQVSYKIVTFTRLLSLATGTQSITGVGFTPRLIQFQVGILDNSATGGWASAGESDGVSNYCLEFWPGGCANIPPRNSGDPARQRVELPRVKRRFDGRGWIYAVLGQGQCAGGDRHHSGNLL